MEAQSSDARRSFAATPVVVECANTRAPSRPIAIIVSVSASCSKPTVPSCGAMSVLRAETHRIRHTISCVGSVAIELGVPVGRRPGIRVRKRIEFAPQRPLQADGSRAGAEDRGGGTEHRLPIGVAGRAGVAPVCGRACGIEPTSEAAGSRSAHVRVSAVVAATGANWITSLYRVATPV